MKNPLRLAAVAIAVAALLSACDDGSPEPSPTASASAPSPSTSATLDGFSTDDVSEEAEDFGQLVAVRVGHHPTFERVVLEFAEDVPGYTVKYVELPVSEDGSGEPVQLLDAQFAVQIVLTPASGFDMDAGEETYTGPQMITKDNTTEITSVASSGDFESVLSWAVGLQHRVPFKVATLESPARLVIDFQTS